MDNSRRWFGWVAVGLSVLALLVALAGSGFGSRIGAVAGGGSAPQSYAQPSQGQQSSGQQGGQAGPGMNAQPSQGQQSSGQQGGQAGPGMNAQPGQRQRGGGQQGGPGMNTQQGREQRGGGFGLGGWLGFPLRLLGGVSQMAMLALLFGLGLLLLRRRVVGGVPAVAQAAAPAPTPSPTGEYYTEEPGDQAE
jgi:hypothetical protein